jgi:serine/threonine protein kinase
MIDGVDDGEGAALAQEGQSLGVGQAVLVFFGVFSGIFFGRRGRGARHRANNTKTTPATPPTPTPKQNSDIKPENILLLDDPHAAHAAHAQGHGHGHGHGAATGAPPASVVGGGPVLKLADLGSCRGMYSRQPYTEYISTRWYR